MLSHPVDMAPPSTTSPALGCMQEIQAQCFKLGIPLRTRHRGRSGRPTPITQLTLSVCVCVCVCRGGS